ncbi:head-tail adaptor protein [Dyadobacter sp. CY261]|uniref:phage head completion protein n=1 Tax=Dyadobacter sp. CY261 TaxID=2907203 RepID=UPI001F422358|nr:head-tail adaptor protein [Dyadobacter sp. CY261]MCF0074477.1 head-tail adaptor protein [Dyadobacter sp. CY261]
MRDRRDRRRGIGIYDRRIQILEPVSEANDYNEDQLSFEVKYGSFPAGKLDSVSEVNEAMEGQVIQSAARVDWQLRFVPDIGIKTSWKIKDLFSGLTYQVIAPIQEIGRREAWLVKTQIVE